MSQNQLSTQIDELEARIDYLSQTIEPVQEKREVNYDREERSHSYTISLDKGSLFASMHYNPNLQVMMMFVNVNGLNEEQDHYRSAKLHYVLDADNIFQLDYLGISVHAGKMQADAHCRDIYYLDRTQGVSQKKAETALLHNDIYACHVVDRVLNSSLLNFLPYVMLIHQDLPVAPAFRSANLKDVVRDIMEEEHWSPKLVAEEPFRASFAFAAIGTQKPLKMVQEYIKGPLAHTTTHIAYDMADATPGQPDFC